MSRRNPIERRAQVALRVLVSVMAALTLLAAASAGAVTGEGVRGEPARESIARDGVTVRYDPSARRLAEHVAELVFKERDDLFRQFAHGSTREITVDVATTEEEFASLSYGGVPDWGAGSAIHGERRIVVRSPRAAGAPHGLRTLVRHELAHLALHDELAGVRAPRWFHEGAASALAGEWRLEESAALALGAWMGTLEPPSRLAAGFPDGEHAARVAYAESYQAVLLMLELTGARDVPELARLVRMSGGVDRALALRAGISSTSFDRLLLERIRDRFGLALLWRRGSFLFLGAAVLVLIGAALRFRASRRRLAEWEREERGERGGRPGGSWR